MYNQKIVLILSAAAAARWLEHCQQDLLAFFLPEETTANKKIRRNTEMKKLTYLIYVIQLTV